MHKTIKIVSWNIAGGRKMKSLDQFDYENEDISYFAEQIGKFSPDIVCLQESHTNAKRSVAAEIAQLMGYEYAYNEVVSPSHIDSDYSLGLAILSREKPISKRLIRYPYPDFPLYFLDGRPAEAHHKGAQVIECSGVVVANTQMLLLPVFGKTYDEGEGAGLARKIDDQLGASFTTPLIFCGDFNYDSPRAIYPNMYEKLTLSEALPDELTRPNKNGDKKTPDHILYSKELTVNDAKVVTVQADHYLCFAELTLG